MSGFIGELDALWLLLIAGVLPNEIWRVFGFLAGRRIDEDAEILVWVRAVATAIVGCVVIQVLLVPPGALATVPALVRFSAFAGGFVIWLLVKRSILAGVIGAELILLGGKWWFGWLRQQSRGAGLRWNFDRAGCTVRQLRVVVFCVRRHASVCVNECLRRGRAMADINEIRAGEVAVAPPAARDAGLEFIGRIHTPWTTRAETPRQGRDDGPVCRIEVFDTWAPALKGLDQFETLFVIYWLHQSRRDLVTQSPRSNGATSGTFALRSPVRPNPVGLSQVQAGRHRGQHRLGARTRLPRRHAADRHQAGPLPSLLTGIGQAASADRCRYRAISARSPEALSSRMEVVMGAHYQRRTAPGPFCRSRAQRRS